MTKRKLDALIEAADRIRFRANQLSMDAEHSGEASVSDALDQFASSLLQAEVSLVKKLARAGYDLQE